MLRVYGETFAARDFIRSFFFVDKVPIRSSTADPQTQFRCFVPHEGFCLRFGQFAAQPMCLVGKGFLFAYEDNIGNRRSWHMGQGTGESLW